MKHLRRVVIDGIANYVVFVPLVLLLNQGWNWPTDVLVKYLLTSVLLCLVGGRIFSVFLKHVWYPLLKEDF